MTPEKLSAKSLRAARRLMNHGGRHWIKGAERRYVNPSVHEPGGMAYLGLTYPSDGYEPAFCSIGACKEAKADDLALITLAEVIAPGEMAQTKSWYGRDSHQLVSQARDVIVSFNDMKSTTWDDVSDAFNRAAKRLADRGRNRS